MKTKTQGSKKAKREAQLLKSKREAQSKESKREAHILKPKREAQSKSPKREAKVKNPKREAQDQKLNARLKIRSQTRGSKSGAKREAQNLISLVSEQQRLTLAFKWSTFAFGVTWLTLASK